jgi:hypothetical protein
MRLLSIFIICLINGILLSSSFADTSSSQDLRKEFFLHGYESSVRQHPEIAIGQLAFLHEATSPGNQADFYGNVIRSKNFNALAEKYHDFLPRLGLSIGSGVWTPFGGVGAEGKFDLTPYMGRMVRYFAGVEEPEDVMRVFSAVATLDSDFLRGIGARVYESYAKPGDPFSALYAVGLSGDPKLPPEVPPFQWT